MLAGVGGQLGPVHADRAHAGEPEFPGQLQHGEEGGWEGRLVGGAEGAEGSGVGMRVGAAIAHGHVAVRGRREGAGAEAAGGVAVDEQGQQHSGGILLTARAPVVHAERSGGDWLGRSQDEVDEMTGGQPVAPVAGQKQRRLAVKVDESGRQALSTHANGKVAA